MKMIGLVRLGADAELRYTPAGDPVLEMSGAYNYGRKGEDGKRPTQWIRLRLWGPRAEKLEQYFTKGTQLLAYVEDAHVETFEKRDGGTGWSLEGRLADFDFAGGGEREEGGERQKAAPAPARQHRAATQQPADDGFGDSDIPF